jgi:hypothetical protein
MRARLPDNESASQVVAPGEPQRRQQRPWQLAHQVDTAHVASPALFAEPNPTVVKAAALGYTGPSPQWPRVRQAHKKQQRELDARR